MNLRISDTSHRLRIWVQISWKIKAFWSYIAYKLQTIVFYLINNRGISKEELRVLEPPCLNILMEKIGKILGKIGKKSEKRILSTPLSNALDTPVNKNVEPMGRENL